MEKYFKNRHKNNWKSGDKIICIQSAGKSSELTIGKTYTIIEVCVDHGADEVKIVGDGNWISNAFCSRFTTIKEQRKKKLQKINSI